MSVKAGIVGFGDGGRLNYKSLCAAGVEVVALCDTDQDKLKQVKKGFKARFYTDFNKLVDQADIDLVVVATPDHKHLEPTRIALKAGKRVFVEKPVATTIKDLLAFQDLVERYPGRILFSENQSFTYPVQAALKNRKKLGSFMTGCTFYIMAECDRIMGEGKWRTEQAYNPCAGGLSHNFMTALLFADAPIVRVRATGDVLTYHKNLDLHGGYDTMEGTLEFDTGRRLNWQACLAVRGSDTLFGHRDIAHFFQFEFGALAYGPRPEFDRLVVAGRNVPFHPEPDSTRDERYFNGLYTHMHKETLSAFYSGRTLHTIHQGINVAAACALAFDSAKQRGVWLDLPSSLIF